MTEKKDIKINARVYDLQGENRTLQIILPPNLSSTVFKFIFFGSETDELHELIYVEASRKYYDRQNQKKHNNYDRQKAEPKEPIG